MKNKDKIQSLQKKIDDLEDKKLQVKSINNTNKAFNIAIELVAAMIVGVIMGLFLDKMFDSRPIFLIICMIFAMIAALKSIWNNNLK